MADNTELRSTLSEKLTWITGLLFIPRKVWAELKLIEFTVCVTTLKAVEFGGGGGGVGEELEDFLHWIKQNSNTNMRMHLFPDTRSLFLSSLMIYVLLIRRCLQDFLFEVQ